MTEISNNPLGFKVEHPGMLTLLQDLGRFGQAKLGLTNGGPGDKLAFNWANRLLENDVNASMLEASFGGLKLTSQINTVICVTGANVPLSINGENKPLWSTHNIAKGDKIELGFASQGIRAYLAVKGGFCVEKQFGSVATVLRENIGGLTGEALKPGDHLPANNAQHSDKQHHLLQQDQPNYDQEIRLRVIPGYQQQQFSRLQQRRFFAGHYQVSKQWDRMGYRLEGPAIKCTQTAMLSEGITLGAIQIPPDGQPIVLMHDRQTIGGYPKIGSVLSLDLSRLAQCGQGANIYFEPITMETAHNELHLAKFRYDKTKVVIKSW